MGDEGPGGVDPVGMTFGCIAGDGPAGATGATGGAGCDAADGAAAGAAGAAATVRGSTRSPFDPQAASTSVSSTREQAQAMRVNIRRHMER